MLFYKYQYSLLFEKGAKERFAEYPRVIYSNNVRSLSKKYNQKK